MPMSQVQRRPDVALLCISSKQQSFSLTNARGDPQVNHLARLPVEILHEVLSWTSSPDILALARTSRHFCMTLVFDNKIWRDARRRFLPMAIPDPTPNWTESAYIAFLFDGKPCEVCGETSYRAPVSIALRANICYNKFGCEIIWRDSLKQINPSELINNADLSHITAVKSWLPYYEGQLVPPRQAYRPLEWEAALNRHKTSVHSTTQHTTVRQEFATKATRLSQIMNHARTLAEWTKSLEERRKEVKDYNTEFLIDNATEKPWQIQDLMNTSLYKSIQLYHIKILKEITEKVFQAVKNDLNQEVTKCGEDRVRSIIDNTTRLNRKALRTYWSTLDVAARGPGPPYSEFCRLNIVKALERKNTSEAIVLKKSKEVRTLHAELKTSPDTREHIKEEVDNWLRETRQALANKLGNTYSSLSSMTELMHAVDRTTAWFQCTRCNKVSRKMSDYQALTFASICTHECQGITKKTRQERPWDVSFFEPDTKAIAAVKELLRVCGLNERTATWDALSKFGSRFLCKSCTCLMVMDASAVVGHSKRHDVIMLELLNPEQSKAILGAPLERGLASQLMGKRISSKRIRLMKVYACRHCNNKKPLTFDGLRSHMKSKHHVGSIRDEDFFKLAAIQESD